MFLSLLDKNAREKCLLTRDAPVVVGVSGGADSLALMVGLHLLGYPLIVAHLDHALRDDSSAEANFVREAARALGRPFVTDRVDVRQAARARGQSLEEAAREVRYQFLFEQARQAQAQAVATAHHADDQVETVVMHFVRGAAQPGLSGMAYRTVIPAWDPSLPLVRPLLGHWREDIDRFVAERNLTPQVDLSNVDQTYFRNRLRHSLIPALETYNPRFKLVMQRMAQVLGEENRYLEALTEDAWQQTLQAARTDRVTWALAPFRRLPLALQRRVLRRAIASLVPDLRDVGFEVIERGVAFVDDPSQSGQIDLVSRLNLVILEGSLILKTWESDLPDGDRPLLPETGFSQILNPGETVPLRHGWRLVCERLPLAPHHPVAAASELPDETVWLDADTLTLPLVVRARQPGERWVPLGMEGRSQKLSDFLINAKAPAHVRGRWPLVCSDGQVAWVVGLRPADPFKVTESTTRVIQLRLLKD